MNWLQIFEEVPEDPKSLVAAMNEVLNDLVSSSFKLCKRTIKSTDAPWICNELKTKHRRRRRIYGRYQRCHEWKAQKRRTDKILKRDKKRYYKKVREKLTEKGSHKIPYKAIKDLKGG